MADGNSDFGLFDLRNVPAEKIKIIPLGYDQDVFNYRPELKITAGMPKRVGAGIPRALR